MRNKTLKEERMDARMKCLGRMDEFKLESIYYVKVGVHGTIISSLVALIFYVLSLYEIINSRLGIALITLWLIIGALFLFITIRWVRSIIYASNMKGLINSIYDALEKDLGKYDDN